MIRLVQKTLAPIKRKVGQIVSRGVVQLVNDSLKMQECQIKILADESLSGVERFQQYGFTSVPFPGAESVNLSVNGNRGHSISICIDDRRYRLVGLQNGELALYTDEGDKLHFKRGKIVNLVTDQFIIDAATQVTINSPLVNVPSGDVVATGISLVSHVHPENDNGGPTGPPQ